MRKVLVHSAIILVVAGAFPGPRHLGAHDQIPAPPQAGPIAIVGGTVHTALGEPIVGGTVLLDGGTIVAVGTDIALPDDCRTIDAAGKMIYPGIVALNTAIGLSEIGAVPVTNDMKETGEINPNVRVEVAWNPDSELIPVARSNGILSALSVPLGGLIAGRAAMMRLDGWTWEDLLLEPDVAMVINWPRRRTASYRDDADKADKNEKNRLERLAKLDNALEEAAAWIRARDAESEKGIPMHATDVRHDALRKVLAGEMPVLVGADEASDIRDVVAWALHWKLELIIVGGARADLVSGLLAEHRIPVILTHVNSLSWRIPYPRYSGFDEPFTLPARLHEAGVPIAIAGAGGGWGAAVSRNIPEIAARAASYGLPREEALRAITLNPARFLGLDDRIGSIEPGRAATLFICDGDILEITSRVESAFIDGREIDLNDKQKRLYEKYSTKYRQLGLIE